MKKPILISIIFVALCFNMKGQNAYYDAILLVQKKDSIKMVYDSINVPKYKGFYSFSLIKNLINQKKIYSQAEFESIYNFCFAKNPLDEAKIPVLNKIKLQHFFISFYAYVKLIAEEDKYFKDNQERLYTIRENINKIWDSTQDSLNNTFQTDSCFKTRNLSTQVISVKSVVKANSNKDHFLFLMKPLPALLSLVDNIFKDGGTLKDSLYFYIKPSILDTCISREHSSINTFLIAQSRKIKGEHFNYATELKRLSLKYDSTRHTLTSIITNTSTFNLENIAISSPNVTIKQLTDLLSQDVKNSITAPAKTTTTFSSDFTTRLIDATAQFLVQRTKEEITLAFFDKFKERLETIPELKCLFPSTHTMLQSSENLFRLPTMGKVWTSAFHSDLINMPRSFESFVNAGHQDIAKKNEFKLFMIGYHTFDMLGRGVHPANLLDFLKVQYANDIQDSLEISNTIRLVNLISRNLKDTTHTDTSRKNKVWLQLSDIEKLKNEDARKYFIGLLYQQDPLLFDHIKLNFKLNSTSFATSNSLKKWFNITNNFNNLDQTLNQFVIFLSDIENQIEAIKQKEDINKGAKESLGQYLHYTQLVFDAIDLGFRVKFLMSQNNSDDNYYKSEYYVKYRSIGTNTIDAMKSFYNKQYGAGLLHTLQVIEPIWKLVTDRNFSTDTNTIKILAENNLSSLNSRIITNENKVKTAIDEYEGLLKSTSINTDSLTKKIKSIESTQVELMKAKELKNEYVSIKDNIKESFSDERRDKMQNIFEKITFYANFISDIITADSTTDLKLIINKYASPVGSYSIKRSSQFSVDINAYPGLFAGYETPIQANSGLATWQFTNGITAPIGVSFSWGKRKETEEYASIYNPNIKRGHSLGLFFPIVDIGAAFSYRWTNEDISKGLAPIKFSQIFSPGLYFVYGFKNAPISIMVGGQYTPQLREIINTTQADTVSKTIVTSSTSTTITSNINYGTANKIGVSMFRFGFTISADISIFNFYNRRRKIEK